MANIFVAATATWNGKALKNARKDVNVFEKQVQKLGRTIGVSLSAAALVNYSKKAVQAFAADEKAAKALEQQLKNTGYQFSAPGVEMYIANLQKVTGVLDDELRPAFQSLLTVTGSITLSQEALNTALNVSAATGKSLAEVSQALAKGYSGQTTALSRLGAGLSKATIKAGNMDEILAELNNKFAGQAQARLTTYSGKMDLLRVASANVSEEIGKGIIGALEALSANTSIDETTRKMENLGKSTGKTITGFGVLIAELKKIPGLTGLKDILTGTNIFNLLGKLSEINAQGKYPTAAAKETPAMGRIAAQQRKLEAAALKNSVALRKAENEQLKSKTEVDKLKDKFDLERIGLAAALNYQLTDEQKLRVNALTAIANNNEALAKKYNAELDATAKTKLLADALAKAGLAVDAFSSFAMGAVQRGEYADVYKNISNVPTQSAGGAMQLPSSASSFAMGGVSRGEYAPVTVNVAGSVLTEQDLTNTINETILRINKMGRGTTPAGGLSGGT